VHVVDAPRLEGDGLTPTQAVQKINDELAAYNPALLKLPQIIAANKCDLPIDDEYMAELKQYAATHNWPIYLISGATGQGLTDLVRGIAEALKTAPEATGFETDYETYFEPERQEESIIIEKVKDGLYSVEGPGIERMLGYTNMADEKGFAFFQRFMRQRGIIDKLEELGIQENDTVQLYEHEFDYWK